MLGIEPCVHFLEAAHLGELALLEGAKAGRLGRVEVRDEKRPTACGKQQHNKRQAASSESRDEASLRHRSSSIRDVAAPESAASRYTRLYAA